MAEMVEKAFIIYAISHIKLKQIFRCKKRTNTSVTGPDRAGKSSLLNIYETKLLNEIAKLSQNDRARTI